MPARRPLAERHAEKVDRLGPDECWPWLASVDRDGYGKIGELSKSRRAHVVALELHTGQQANGRHALHSCDNPGCNNPGHLRWGTNEENIADMHRRNRRFYAIPVDVREAMVARYGVLQNYCHVGAEFGYCNQTVRKVVLRAVAR